MVRELLWYSLTPNLCIEQYALKRLMMQTVYVVHQIYLSSRLLVITADVTKSSKDETQMMQLQCVNDR